MASSSLCTKSTLFLSSSHPQQQQQGSSDSFKLFQSNNFVKYRSSGSSSLRSSSRSLSTHAGSSRTRLLVSAKSTSQVIMDPFESKTGSGAPTIVEVDLRDRSYPIYIGSGLLNQPELLQGHVHGKKVLVITNTTIAPLYLDKVISALTDGNPNVTVEIVILADGEQFKNMVDILRKLS